jgi:hypothetical protein
MSKINEPLSKAWLVALMAASLAACGGGGGGDSSPPPSGTQPPPAPAPPPPPSSPDAPPLSATVTDITSGDRIGAIHWANGNTASGGDGSPVDGIECLLNMPEDYHVHAYVGVYLNGELLAVPSSVGMVTRTPDPRCYYAIHTHDMSGKIHVESGAPGTFTLGQLFNIWGQPLSDTNVAGLTGNPVEVFVVENGAVTEVESNWGDIELTSMKMIHIVVGTRPTKLRNITWTGN